MNNGKTIPPKEYHLLEIVAERLGCACLSDLRMPQYRERAMKELQEGDFDHLEVNEYKDAVHYLAPPLKTMLYGTTEDKKLFESWQSGNQYFTVIALYHSYDTFLSALCSDQYEAAVCMVDGDPGFEAVKAAHAHRPDTPMMWFPKSSEHTLETFRYGCILCGMQHQIGAKDLDWAVRNCREKMREARREKRRVESEEHNTVNESQGE